MRAQSAHDRGSTLVVTVSVVATILVLLASAVSYTGAISKTSARTRKTGLAMEIADGHLENLFTRWRNVSRIQVTQAIKKKITVSAFALPTQYFFTDLYNPGPTPSPDPTTTGLTGPPPIIALPDKSLFPTEPNYAVTQYRVQAVTPMVELQQDRPDLFPTPSDPEGSIVGVSTQPAAAFGPNTSTTNGQYSYFYLASVDVKVPAIGTQSGFVTAKVRRVFEKKYDEPFSFAMFYVDDLELHPTSPMTITGPIQTNGNLYIGTSNFTAADPTTSFPTSGKVAFSNMYVNGASPQDPLHTSFSVPNFPDLEPPSMQAAFLPFGWNLNLDASTTNNQSYHELIERPDPAATSDPIASIRFYNQADYHVIVDSSVAAPNNIKIYDKTGSIANGSDANTIQNALTNGGTIDQAIIQDVREGGPVLVTSINIGDISKNSTLGMLYISDISAGTPVTVTFNGTSYTTSKRGIRIKNGATITPAPGLTFVAENPIYIQGDYNTGTSPPSNSGTYTSPIASGYTLKPCAIVADAINVLSNAWNDTTPTASRVASNTTINAALVTGNVPSNGTNYSGGGENFIRFLENWSGKSFTYYGSMVQMWQSKQGTGVWTGSSSVYTAPSTNKWFYDTSLETTVPPGNFQLAAYLQQQRWYQVY
jgi:hypothetical protein